MSVVERPVVSIRCFRLRQVFLRDVHGWGGFNDQVGAFLEAAVAARFNFMVSGETFAGKTTLVRALGNAIPAHERLVTVEHFRELGFGSWPDLHRDVVEMEERPANAEGVGAMTMADLVERARRLNPDRLIVGEVIGGEVIAMLDAMTQGEDGSLSTIHARNAPMVFQRIATYAQRAGLPLQACHLLTAGALDFIVHLSKRTLRDGTVKRFISSVREVVGYDGQQVISSEIFSEAPGMTQAAAAPITLARTVRLSACGYSESAWTRK
jgi:Flp pilus assembly CpaF family ATPase